MAADANNIIRILSSTVMLFTRSTDQGSTFSPPQAPVPTNRPLRMQSVVDSKGNIHLVWQDSPNNNNVDVFWSLSTDGGLTFSSPQNVSNSSFNSQNPVVASDSRGNAYIVWMQPTGAGSTQNVFFSRSIGFSSLTLNPATVSGGGSTTGTLTLSAPAPSGGVTISMSSSDWNVGGPTAESVTIPEGATSATFSVSTNSVSQAATVTISGSYAGVDQSATLTVTPPALTAESLNASSVIGGATPAGTITIDQPAPAAGIVVSLSSSNPAVASVPASVTVPQWSTSVDFAVTTSAVTNATSVTITATSGSVTRTVSLMVMPATLVSLTTDSSTIGGGSCTAMVQLSGPAPGGGAVVTLSSSDPNSASVPDSVTVSAGASIAYFPVSGHSVSQPTSVIITATYQGASQSVSLTVTP